MRYINSLLTFDIDVVGKYVSKNNNLSVQNVHYKAVRKVKGRKALRRPRKTDRYGCNM